MLILYVLSVLDWTFPILSDTFALPHEGGANILGLVRVQYLEGGTKK